MKLVWKPESNKSWMRGFTLIEFLVVFSIVTLVIPSLFGLTYTLIRQQGRIIALQVVKRQGDLVLNHMKTTIRNNARGVYNGTLAAPSALCTTAGSNSSNNTKVYFQKSTLASSYFGYSTTVDAGSSRTLLQYESTGAATTQLTSTALSVSAISIGCSRTTDYSNPVLTISYTLTEPVNNVSLTYQTAITLRAH